MGRWVTSQEIQILKEWMVEQERGQDERMGKLEARMTGSEQTMAGLRETVTAMDVRLRGFDSVIDRLERSVKPIEDLATIVNRGKLYWAKAAGFVGGMLVLLDLIARSLPRLHWPW